MKTQSPAFPFDHPEILQTAMPMGGIGAGCICLNGHGGLQDFSIRNRPATTALPDGHDAHEAAFAVLHIIGKKPVTRILEGPLPPEKVYDQGLQGQGYRHGLYEGLPRFQRSRFRSGYPFGQVALSDPQVPVQVDITGWSPFIPLDDVASGIPCAILEYSLRNTSRRNVDFEFSYHLSHLADAGCDQGASTRNVVIPGKGVFLTNSEPSCSENYGSASVTAIGHRPKIKAMWLRGGWFDAISALWREVESGRFIPNDGKADAGRTGRNGGSLLVKATLAPGERTTIPVVISWHFPNSNLREGGPAPAECEPGSCCSGPLWKPFYSSQWSDAAAVATFIHDNYAGLRRRTVAFQRALLGSSLPREVLDAVSANLAILKSPTVLRQDNGNLWGWEGCFAGSGCCSGSCTHVWNYAQTFPHLFPKLERTLREQELRWSMDASGHINFRAALPDGPSRHDYYCAADGQLGGVMKTFREWQISGDTDWLRGLYPLVKLSIDHCINQWDPDRRGALVEPHHNTYDIEFWGADGMCGSIYVGALSAMAAMAAALGHKEDASEYTTLAGRAAKFMEEVLFNGEYFEQKVQFRNLRDTSFQEMVEGRREVNESKEMMTLLKKEGPKYQYGKGCISDGVIGAWMARMYGIDTPLDRKKVVKNLRAIHRHNYRKNFIGHANCQRPGYALAHEPGLLLCSWPRGGKPTLPFVYSDEVWTGIEYQVASHLISEGLVKEGLEIVKAVRSRYEGRVRNPWNEYECGNYYARAMASYALLGAISGFRYSAVDRTLWLAPKLEKRPFTVFFSTASGFGSLSLRAQMLTISLLEGSLELRRVHVVSGGISRDLAINATVQAGKPFSIRLDAGITTKRKGA